MTIKLRQLIKRYMCLVILCFLSSYFIIISINSTQLFNNVAEFVENTYTNNFLPKPRQILVEISDSTENILPPGCDYSRATIDFTKSYDWCIVGAGLSGTVFAERASELNESVLIMDYRQHIGGNCYDFIDQKTGVLRNQYGSHLFHTKIALVWNYVNNPRSPPWKQWYHMKYGFINKTYVPIPPNIMTVNRLFNLNIQSEDEMGKWLRSVQIPCPKNGCQNGEEMAKSRVGEKLYDAIFKTYTIKQWGKSPKEMEASVTARIPVRANWDPRYFDDKWQALPSEGYTAWFEGILKHRLIDVVLNTNFHDHQTHLEKNCGKIVYTGPVDLYFEAFRMEKLEYRSIKFTEERYYTMSGYILPTPVVNYPGSETPYTRAVEYKHYLHRPSSHSIVVKETTSDVGEPYYPVPTKRNIQLYQKYKHLATDLERKSKVIFVGRLANYKYFDMDKAIYNALKLFYQSNWYKYFMGKQFDKYREEISEKMMMQRREIGLKRASVCDHPLYTGEFGMELRVNVPWAHYKSKICRVYTKGVPGTKYMYFFSYNHTVEAEKRSYKLLPNGNPFQSTIVHMNDFPYDTEWLAPNFKDFFIRPDIYELLNDKPLVVITNKYNKEWKTNDPQNFISVVLLRDILTYLVPKYSILYKRHTNVLLQDHNEMWNGNLDFADKEMIRNEFPTVVLYEDLEAGLNDVEDQNLLLFGVMSLSDRFLSVQGGSAVLSSYFKGNNTILISKGKELQYEDYSYFHRFSNASVEWTNRDKIHLFNSKTKSNNIKQTEKEFFDLVKQRL